MNRTCTLLLFISMSAAQNAAAQPKQPAQTPARLTDVYHVHFAKAALGKARQLGDFLKTQDPKAPMPGHRLVLRHQAGDEWDYLVIEHLGTKATVDADSPAPPAAARDSREWHNDTFAGGPPWAEFARAMGIADGSAAKTADSLYLVGVHLAAPGHRDQLEKILRESRDDGDLSAGSLVMQHLEGGSWQYLAIDRYNSWPDYAKSESNSRAQMQKGTGGWFQIRDHGASHNDTLADRIAP